MGLVERREHVRRLGEHYRANQQRACGLMQIAVSSFRYRSRRSDNGLRERLRELAREKPRFGYRRLHVLQRRSGEAVNHKRVNRVYREAGLSLRRKKRKHCVRAGSRCGSARQPTRSGHWILRTTQWAAGERSAC